MLFVYITVVLLAFAGLVYEHLPLRSWVDSHEAARISAMQEAQKANVAQQNLLVRTLMYGLLRDIPAAFLVRIATIHGDLTPKSSHQLLWGVVNSVSAFGRPEVEMFSNKPLTSWNDFLGTLLERKCAFMRMSDLTNPEAIALMHAVHAAAFLSCPIYSPKGEMVGALFVFWDSVVNPIDVDGAKRLGGATASTLATLMR